MHKSQSSSHQLLKCEFQFFKFQNKLFLSFSTLFFLFSKLKKMISSKFSNFSPLGSMCDTHSQQCLQFIFLLLVLLASWNFLFKFYLVYLLIYLRI